jgi:hypothetical protein
VLEVMVGGSGLVAGQERGQLRGGPGELKFRSLGAVSW